MKIIRENSRFRIIWDLFVLVLIIASCTMIPFQAAFVHVAQHASSIIIYLIDLFFLVDIFLNFFTSFRHRGTEVKDRKKAGYAFIIGKIASLFSNIDAAKANFWNRIEAVTQYLRSRHVPQNLNEQVRNYYEYLWAHHRGVKEDAIFDDLPTPFRLEILRYLTRELLEKVPLFKFCSPALRNVLLLALKPQTYAPDGYIAREGEVGNEIFFISRGKIEITSNAGSNFHGTLEGGGLFRRSLSHSR